MAASWTERVWRWAGTAPVMGAFTGLVDAIGIITAVATPPFSNRVGSAPGAPDFPFAPWTSCAAVGGGLATQAMRAPDGVLVRPADARGGADVALVPIRKYREAEAFMAELGCQLAAGAAP